MLQKAMMAAAALAAMAVAAAVGVISLAFAIYALLRPLLTPAGAAGAVAAICALTITVAGLIAARDAAESRTRAAETESPGLVAQLMELVREKPLAAGGLALAAGLTVIRNPRVMAVILRTVLEAWPVAGGTDKPPRRRRGKI